MLTITSGFLHGLNVKIKVRPPCLTIYVTMFFQNELLSVAKRIQEKPAVPAKSRPFRTPLGIKLDSLLHYLTITPN